MEDEIDVLEQRLHGFDVAAIGFGEVDSLRQIVEVRRRSCCPQPTTSSPECVYASARWLPRKPATRR